MISSIQFKFDSITKKITVNIFAILVVFLLMGCNHNKVLELDNHETENHHKKEVFYSLPGLKHGLLQSPINILSEQSEQKKT